MKFLDQELLKERCDIDWLSQIGTNRHSDEIVRFTKTFQIHQLSKIEIKRLFQLWFGLFIKVIDPKSKNRVIMIEILFLFLIINLFFIQRFLIRDRLDYSDCIFDQLFLFGIWQFDPNINILVSFLHQCVLEYILIALVDIKMDYVNLKSLNNPLDKMGTSIQMKPSRCGI